MKHLEPFKAFICNLQFEINRIGIKVQGFHLSLYIPAYLCELIHGKLLITFT